MISAILSVIIKLLAFVISFILSIIFAFIPSFDFQSFTEVYTDFYALLGQAMNLTYFMIGTPVFFYVDILILLFGWKHIALPIINFIRKVALD